MISITRIVPLRPNSEGRQAADSTPVFRAGEPSRAGYHAAMPRDAIDPDALEDFAARADEGPVYMLNLIALQPGGAEGYAEYGRRVAPLLAEAGCEIVYSGHGAELLNGREEDAWDLVLLVRYPSRRALLSLITSQAYQAVGRYRDESVTRSVLLATDPAGIVAGAASSERETGDRRG